MLQKLIEFGKQLFSVMQKLQKHEEDLKDVRKDIVQLRHEMTELTRIVERLAFELQKDRENAEREREIHRLRLENIILRFNRGLPPGNKDESVNEE